MPSQPRLVDIIAAVPQEYKKVNYCIVLGSIEQGNFIDKRLISINEKIHC